MTASSKNDGVADRIWQILASVKLSIVLLVSLALTSVFGTLVPQNASPHAYEETFGHLGFKVFEFFGMADMYHAWWFRLLLILLAVNLMVCSLERLPGIVSLIRKEPVRNPGRFEHRKNAMSGHADLKMADAFAMLSGKLRVLGKFPSQSEEPGAVLFFAESGRWTRLGPYVVHAGILFLLMGGLIGSLFGFEGTAAIPVKTQTDLIQLGGSDQQIRLPFSVRCDAFSVKFHDNGTPDEYRSTLTILENGKEVLTSDILVNHPLRYQGISFYQSTYGSTDPTGVKLKIVDKAANTETEVPVEIGRPIDIPGRNQQVVFTAFRQRFEIRGHAFQNAFLGAILENGAPVEMLILPTDHPGFDKMRKSPYYLEITAYDHGWYTGLQVKQDPGVWMVYAGFVCMILGCGITFFMAHRQIGIVLRDADGLCRVTVSGIANKNPLGMERDIELLFGRVSAQLGGLKKLLSNKE